MDLFGGTDIATRTHTGITTFVYDADGGEVP